MQGAEAVISRPTLVRGAGAVISRPCPLQVKRVLTINVNISLRADGGQHSTGQFINPPVLKSEECMAAGQGKCYLQCFSFWF